MKDSGEKTILQFLIWVGGCCRIGNIVSNNSSTSAIQFPETKTWGNRLSIAKRSDSKEHHYFLLTDCNRSPQITDTRVWNWQIPDLWSTNNFNLVDLTSTSVRFKFMEQHLTPTNQQLWSSFHVSINLEYLLSTTTAEGTHCQSSPVRRAEGAWVRWRYRPWRATRRYRCGCDSACSPWTAPRRWPSQRADRAPPQSVLRSHSPEHSSACPATSRPDETPPCALSCNK